MASYEFNLGPYSSDVLAAYRTFASWLGEVSERKLLWKFNESPFGAGVAIVVRNQGGEVVGMNAYQPVVIRTADGSALRGHQSMDTVIAESCRNQGLLTRVFRAYYERTNVDFVYGFPNRNSAHALFNKLGWTRFGLVPTRVKALRTGFLARRLGLDFINLAVPQFRRVRGSSSLLASFNDTHEAAWRSLLENSPGLWGVERSADYLNWRYRDHPTHNYRILSRPDGSFIVSIIRHKQGARILYLMEALGQPATLIDMLREVHADAREQGAELAMAWGGAQAPLKQVFRTVGYHAIPAWLRGDYEINFGARMFGTASGPQRSQDWFVSLSDSDTA